MPKLTGEGHEYASDDLRKLLLYLRAETFSGVPIDSVAIVVVIVAVDMMDVLQLFGCPKTVAIDSLPFD